MASKKVNKSKSQPVTKAAKPPKAAKVMNYFRSGTAVATIAAFVEDQKIHGIDTVLSHVRKQLGIDEDAAKFAFAVLFTQKYSGGAIGKIAAKKLGGATVNLEKGTVQFSTARRTTEVIPAKAKAKPEPKAQPGDKSSSVKKSEHAAPPSMTSGQESTAKTAEAGVEERLKATEITN